MDTDLVFRISSTTVLAGWAALLVRPFVPRFSDLVASFVIPMLLAVAYTGLVMAYWSSGQGGFDTLDNVALLFQTRELLLAGWIHYLAFDLLIGGWIAKASDDLGISRLIQAPILVATFMFGPLGWLLFQGVRMGQRALATEGASP